MDRAYASGAAGIPPAAPASPSIGYPQAANPGLGAPATKPGPYWYHMITEEIRGVIAAAGLAPDQADVTQLSVAITKMHLEQMGTAYTSAGAAPNYTLTPAPAITAYAAGRRYRVKFHAAGAGANQLNINGLGNKALKQYDNSGAKVAATIAANQLADVEYDGVDFVLLDALPSGLTTADFTGANQLLAGNGYQKLPGGLILQWINDATWPVNMPVANKAYTWPIAFPTLCLIASPTLLDATGTVTASACGVVSKSATGATIRAEEWTAVTQNTAVMIFALGY